MKHSKVISAFLFIPIIIVSAFSCVNAPENTTETAINTRETISKTIEPYTSVTTEPIISTNEENFPDGSDDISFSLFAFCGDELEISKSISDLTSNIFDINNMDATQYSFFTRKYYSSIIGPVYEYTSKVRETARDNLKKFLSLIGIYAEDAEINTNNTVYQEEYIKDGLEVGSSINYGIRISNTSFDVDINTSPEDILKLINNDIRIKSACIYNNIKNPFVYKTVRYYQSGEFMGKICEVTFKIIDKSNYINDAQNNVIKYVEITYNLEFTAESRCILRIANEPVTEISVKEEDAVSYDEALDFLQKGYYYLGKGLFPSIIIPVSLSEVEFCELTYTNIFNYISLPNNKITPAYYIPCYKFYVKGEKDQNVPELTDYYICYIPAIRNYAVFPDKY